MRIDWLDAARGFSILAVVFLHVCGMFWDYDMLPDAYGSFNEALEYVRMPAFFMVSGILMNFSIGLSWGRFLEKKILILLWVYILWQLILWAMSYILPWPYPWPDPVWALVKIGIAPRTHLWFLWVLLIYFVAARLLRSWGPLALLATVVLAVLSHAGIVSLPNERHNDLLTHAPYFFFGTVCGRAFAERISAHPIAAGVLGGLGLVILTQGEVTDYHMLPISVFGLLLLCAVMVVLRRSAALSGGLVWAGRHALEVFILHMPLAGLPIYLGVGSYLAGLDLPRAAHFALPILVSAAVVVSSVTLRRMATAHGLGVLFVAPAAMKDRLPLSIGSPSSAAASRSPRGS